MDVNYDGSKSANMGNEKYNYLPRITQGKQGLVKPECVAEASELWNAIN